MKKDGLKLMSDYLFFKNYSQRKDNGELETWSESLERIYGMHKNFLIYKGYDMNVLQPILDEAKSLENQKKFLSSQRNRQWASPNFYEGTLKNNFRSFNCSSTYIDRPEVFGEIAYLLYAGAGVGYSLHKEYVNKLPKIADKIEVMPNVFVIEDSSDGISTAINVLIGSAFSSGNIPTFDFSQIRPKGSLISNKFIASGPQPTIELFDKIIEILKNAQGRQLKTIEAHRIICLIAKSIVSHGIRRSASISLFDKDDEDMLNAKTNYTWFNEYPEFAMANNSAIVLFGENFGYEDYKKLFEYTKTWGEPGIAKFNSYEYTGNPSREVA